MQSIQSRNNTDTSGKFMSISSIIGQEDHPLTLQERRLRNKAASAKYRQKKNQQQNEMQLMITRLSEQNMVLERQLEELRVENDRLKSTADKLRGNIVAKKMLKKWIGKGDAYWSDDEDLDSISS